MRSVTAREAEDAFADLIAAVKREPVAVTEGGAPSAVVMSFDDYQRITGRARRELVETMQRMREHVATQGLDEAKLAELLADES